MMMMNTIERRRHNHSILTTSLLTVLFLILLGGVEQAQAQWSSSGGNTTTTDKVGVGTTSPNGGTVQIQSTSPDNHLYVSSAAPDIVFGNNTTRANATAIGFVGFATSANHFATGSAAGDLLVGTSQSNKLHWVTNGSIRATVDGSGNVGIGTTSPGAKLQIVDSTTVNGSFKFRSAAFESAGSSQIELGADNLGTGNFAMSQIVSKLTDGTANAQKVDVAIRTLNSGTMTDVVRISSSGNFGIGSTSPQAPLWVKTATDKNLGIALINNRAQLYAANDANTNLTEMAIRGSTLILNDAGGSVGVGTATPDSNYKLDVNGSVKVSGNISAKYQDVAEWVPATHALPAGTVVILNPTKSNEVMASTTAYDTRVAGVVSEHPGLALGEEGKDKVLVATTGRVKIKVDATKACIHVGDLLVTSDVEGVAMKSEPVDLGGVKIHRPGTLIGKALEPLESGKGEILVLLSLQ
jgi:hypothetical protein